MKRGFSLFLVGLGVLFSGFSFAEQNLICRSSISKSTPMEALAAARTRAQEDLKTKTSGIAISISQSVVFNPKYGQFTASICTLYEMDD